MAQPSTRTPAGPLLAVLIALALTASACGGRDDDDAGTATSLMFTTSSTSASGTDTTDGDTTTTEGPTTTTTASTTTGDGPAWTAASYTLTPVAELDRPVALAVRPGVGDLWVAERDGRVRTLAGELALDITELVGTEGEGGLLGLTFLADGERLVVSYTDRRGDSVVADYRMVGDEADPTTERVLLRVDQPYSNHNGGQVTLGPDGFLYIGLGDGGSGGDPHGNGQDTTTLLGSILRIDPGQQSGETAYDVPSDNPFADGADGRPEIWLWGVRNPWRFSFDRANGDLWIGDVGQNAIEEVDHLPADGGTAGRGLNLGWRVYEGNEVFDPEAAAPPDAVFPVFTYTHDQGRCSVTGGHVYRGTAIPDLDGVYVFGDYCSGELLGLREVADGVLVSNLVTDRPVGNLISFGEDAEGELHILAADGSIYRLDGPQC
jgi:glucose/arabinose dehydrogenase